MKNFPFYSKAFLLSVIAFTPLFTSCEDKPSPPNPDPEPIPAIGYAGWVDNPVWDVSLLGVDLSTYPDGIFDTVPMPVPQKPIGILPQLADGAAFNSPAYDAFIIDEGDYTGMGRIEITKSGTPDQPRLISCPSRKCIFDAFYFKGANYWYLDGITFSGKSNINPENGWEFGDRTVVIGDHNTFNRCEWSNTIGPRFRGDYNTVQRCRVGEKPKVGFDIGGILVDAGPGEESRGHRTMYCLLDGPTDGAGCNWDEASSNGSVPGLVIAFNYMQADTNVTINEWGWETVNSENAFDLKNGALTDLPADRGYVVGNISVGHRPTSPNGSSGSYGDGGTIHRMAYGYDIEGNIFLNDAFAIDIASNKPNSKDHVGFIRFRNNLILYPASGFQRPDRGNDKDGRAIRILCPTCECSDNIIVGAALPDPIISGNGAKVGDNKIYPPLKEGDDIIKIETAAGVFYMPKL